MYSTVIQYDLNIYNTYIVEAESDTALLIRFVWVSAKFGTCTVGNVNGTLVEDKMRRFKVEYAHFSFNKCPIYTHDGASAEFSTNSHETDKDNSVFHVKTPFFFLSIIEFCPRYLPVRSAHPSLLAHWYAKKALRAPFSVYRGFVSEWYREESRKIPVLENLRKFFSFS